MIVNWNNKRTVSCLLNERYRNGWH